jgi:hypothetical protein
MIETELSPELADEIIVETGISGSYTSVGHYPFDDVVKIVSALSAKTDIPLPTLLESFGQYLFSKLIVGHQELLPANTTMIDLLAHLDSKIHVEVLKLYPNATLPTFSVLDKGHRHIDLLYRSPRQLEQLAVGLIKGCASFFDTECSIDLKHLHNEHNEVEISVKML